MSQRLFTRDEDEKIIHLREVLKKSFAEIARRLGRSSGWCISWRYSRVLRPDAAPKPHPEAKERRCMRCPSMFLSPHNGVRHCDPCRVALSSDDDGTPEPSRPSKNRSGYQNSYVADLYAGEFPAQRCRGG